MIWLDAMLYRIRKAAVRVMERQKKRVPRQKVLGNVTTKVCVKFSIYSIGKQFRLYKTLRTSAQMTVCVNYFY